VIASAVTAVLVTLAIAAYVLIALAWATRTPCVVKRYIAAGLDFGDAVDMLPAVGRCVGFDDLRRKFHDAEAAVVRAGYEPVDFGVFIDAVGWGGPKPVVRRAASKTLPVARTVQP
jgi:hypothetical protein